MLKNNLFAVTKKINIIFLDIDGVMYVGDWADQNHQKRLQDETINDIKRDPEIIEKIPDILTWNHTELFSLSKVLGFSKEAIHNLQNLCEKLDAKIVISSSWREKKTVEQLKKLFSFAGFSQYIIDSTPYINEKHRGEEIAAWIEKNVHQVQSFVILDDNLFDIADKFDNRFVHCHTLFSNDCLYEEAYSILKIPLNKHTDNIKKITDIDCLKLRLAIIEDNIAIRFGKKDKQKMVGQIEIAINESEDEPRSWVKMHDFLMNNDWDNTVVGAYNEVSYEEQRAVAIYINDGEDYLKIKSLFDHNKNINVSIYNENPSLLIDKLIQKEEKKSNVIEEDGYSDSDNYFCQYYTFKKIEKRNFSNIFNEINDINNIRKKYICTYLKQIILMQSAYNKKRFSYTCDQAAVEYGSEVYRNVNNLDNEVIIENSEASLISFAFNSKHHH